MQKVPGLAVGLKQSTEFLASHYKAGATTTSPVPAQVVSAGNMDYADFPVAGPVGFSPIASDYHRKVPLLAVAGTEPGGKIKTEPLGAVHVFEEDGSEVEEASVQRALPPSKLSWNPVHRYLAIGWEQGDVMLWNHSSKQLHELQMLHMARITFLEWSTDGAFLISGDQKGHIGIWSLARTGKPSLIQQHKRQGAVSHCVFGPDNSRDEKQNASYVPPIYVATASKEILHCADGKVNVIASEESPIEALLFDEPRNTLVVLSNKLVLVQHTLDQDGSVLKSSEAKLDGRHFGGCAWVGPSILAICTKSDSIRIWDLEQNEVSSLQSKITMALRQSGARSTDDDRRHTSSRIISLAVDLSAGILVGIAAKRSIFVWRHRGDAGDSSEGQSGMWDPLPVLTCETAGLLEGVHCGGGKGLIAIQGDAGVSILRRQALSSSYGNGTAGVQVSSTRVVVESQTMATNLETDIAIHGLDVSKDSIIVWGGNQLGIYELVRGHKIARSVGLYECTSTCNVLGLEETVYTVEGNTIIGKSFHWEKKHQMKIEDARAITCLARSGNFLVAATEDCVLAIWDVSRREPVRTAPPKRMQRDVSCIKSINVNQSGSHVSFLAEVNGVADSSIWIWDTTSNTTLTHDFSTSHQVPISHHWDDAVPMLLAIEASSSGVAIEEEDTTAATTGSRSNQITTLFVTSEDGIIVQHKLSVPPTDGALMGLKLPHLLHVNRNHSDGHKVSAIERRTVPSFEGLENTSDAVRNAMVSFSYNLAIGNMDEAFKAVRAIKSEKVWESMARMCVSTRRMDVAAVCVGSMGDATGARAIREATDRDGDPGVAAAALAVQLGMVDIAENIYKEKGRYDLLNKLYQDCGKWQEAIEVARSQDRIHLRTTHYNHAKFLEMSGKTKEAIAAYERSGTHHFEVPRMLGDDADALEDYVKASGSKELLKWWAQYLESSQEMGGALEYYVASGDALSQTRVHCCLGDIGKARKIVDATKDKAAAYYLARQFENSEQVDPAIEYYSRSGCYSNAIRLAKEFGKTELMLGLALRSTPRDMVEAAQFYENNGSHDRAVTLYHKGGRVSKALELCFEHKLFDCLADISEDLQQGTDPELLQRAADFFIQSQQYDKAVALLIAAEQFDEAIEICANHNVVVTEDMAEKMTLEKSEDNTYRNSLLEKVADVCASQGSYQLATKKYTQAGAKSKAMNALLKSGDTEKIIFFANKSRQKDIYVKAANYLQTLDWRSDADIMNNIVLFYTKGKALDNLSRFYEACAQNEIDDYQSYEKAINALKEALKYLSKAKLKDFEDQEDRVRALQTRISLTERFVAVRAMSTSNPNELVSAAKSLLNDPDIEMALQVGDVYGLIIEHLASREQYQEAYESMKEMRQKIVNVNIAYYVSMQTIEAIHNALGIPLGHGRGAEEEDGGAGDEVDDDVDDNVYH